MFDKEFFSTLFRIKLKTLLATIGFSFLFILVVAILFVAGGSLESGEITIITLTPALQAVFIGLFTYEVIITYMDYYTHFPMAIYAGKTRKQFLFASFVTSAITIAFRIALVFLGVKLLPLASVSINEGINIVSNPAQNDLSGLPTLKNFVYLYGYLMASLYLLAALNYRFGAKIWFFLLGVSLLISIAEMLPFTDKLLLFVRFFNIDYWSQVIGEKASFSLVTGVELLIVLAMTTLITLRLSPIQKTEA